jgi:hypothetical protein
MPVDVAPRVLVTDASGNAVSGVEVTFAVTSGGGFLESAQVTTDAAGQASCGAWILGSSIGLQTLSASVPSATGASFSASNRSRDRRGIRAVI